MKSTAKSPQRQLKRLLPTTHLPFASYSISTHIKMTTQSGITISGPNEPYTIVDSIPRPTPGPGEALVKSLYVGLNPVEPFMQHSGILIESWPAVIGSDVSGVVLETGPGCKKLQKGDYVYTCAPVGISEFSPFQETFLVNEDWVFKKSDAIGLEEAATVGAGLLTAGLSLIDGQGLEIPAAGAKGEQKDEWLVVNGGSGTVGQFFCQIASLCGYKVLASCSPSKNEAVLKAGASAAFNSRASAEDQLAEIEKITGGQFSRIADTTLHAVDLSIKALETISKASVKYFATVDDWSDLKAPDSINFYRVQLGLVGRSSDPGKHITTKIAEMVARFQSHLDAGHLKPLEYHLIPGQGWDKIIEGIAELEAGKLPKKTIVKVQDE